MLDIRNERETGMTIGFVGLGRMGRGMAHNLLRAGEDLLVHDMSPEAVDALVADGARGAQDLAQLGRECRVVFTSLPGPVQLEAVTLSSGGILENARPGLVLFDMSTSSLSLARRIHDEFAAAGATMLDAPVSGGPAGAAAGELVLWVGGDKAAFDAHLDLLTLVGDRPRYVGAIGSGTITKLAHNMLGYMIMQALAETFSVAVKAGMDPLDLWTGIRLGLVGKGSPLDMLVNQFLPGTYEPPAFALQLAHKDASLATSMAHELGVPTPMADLTLADMTEAIAQGMGGQDSRAFLKLQLERAGVEIAVDPEELRLAVQAVREGRF